MAQLALTLVTTVMMNMLLALLSRIAVHCPLRMVSFTAAETAAVSCSSLQNGIAYTFHTMASLSSFKTILLVDMLMSVLHCNTMPAFLSLSEPPVLVFCICRGCCCLTQGSILSDINRNTIFLCQALYARLGLLDRLGITAAFCCTHLHAR